MERGYWAILLIWCPAMVLEIVLIILFVRDWWEGDPR